MNLKNDREVKRMASCHMCGEVYEAETMHVWFDEDDYDKVLVCEKCFYEPPSVESNELWETITNLMGYDS